MDPTFMNMATAQAGGGPSEDWRTRRFSARFLVCAALLHALLLLIPVTSKRLNESGEDFLEVRLLTEDPPEPPEPEPDTPEDV